MIGGSSLSDVLDIVAKFTDNTWSLYGNLQTPRCCMAAITADGHTMVIGGYDSDHT